MDVAVFIEHEIIVCGPNRKNACIIQNAPGIQCGVQAIRDNINSGSLFVWKRFYDYKMFNHEVDRQRKHGYKCEYKHAVFDYNEIVENTKSGGKANEQAVKGR